MPLSERLKGYRADLERRGGRRLLVDIEPDANAALAQLVKSQRFGKTLKDAVSGALLMAAEADRTEKK